MKNKTIYKEILINPYAVTLWLLITNDPHLETARLNQKHKELGLSWGNGWAASTEREFYGPNQNKLVSVFDGKFFDINTLTHEVIHIKNRVFQHAEIKHSFNNDEPETYLCGWLADEINKAYLEYKKLK